MSTLLRESPEECFKCITETLNRNDRERYGILHWLGDGRSLGFNSDTGPIHDIPESVLFEWVDSDIEENGQMLCDTLAKTLDGTKQGRLTRNFIARYGSHEPISKALYGRFWSRSWSGSESEMYRRLREEARDWLVGENDKNVRRWVEDFIHYLASDIERAELNEEREFC
jgi:hypothetical protein